jgi:hypothetical protein
LERAGSVIEDASGRTLQYWRQPFFHVDERVRAAVSPLGLQEVGCSMMPSVWEAMTGRGLRSVTISELLAVS